MTVAAKVVPFQLLHKHCHVISCSVIDSTEMRETLDGVVAYSNKKSIKMFAREVEKLLTGNSLDDGVLEAEAREIPLETEYCHWGLRRPSNQ